MHRLPIVEVTEFCPISPVRPRKSTLESLPKQRRTFIGLAFEHAVEIPITVEVEIDPRARFVSDAKMRAQAPTFIIPREKPPLGKLASLALGLAIGGVLLAIASLLG